jgi:hypothetical protein
MEELCKHLFTSPVEKKSSVNGMIGWGAQAKQKVLYVQYILHVPVL